MKKNDKRLNKILHPKGRKTAQLTRKIIKSTSRDKSKLMHQMKLNLLGEKILWFKNNLQPLDRYTPESTRELIERYLKRFDQELNLIKLKHAIGKRKKRQHANREDIIKMTIQNEENEYATCGLEIPDLLNSNELTLLKNWSGELRFLQNFKLARYTRNQLEKDIMQSANSVGEIESAKKCSS